MTLGFKLDFFLNPKKKSCLVREFIRTENSLKIVTKSDWNIDLETRTVF